jgi:hypothetical protein
VECGPLRWWLLLLLLQQGFRSEAPLWAACSLAASAVGSPSRRLCFTHLKGVVFVCNTLCGCI